MIIKKNKDEIESYLVDASNYKGICDAVYIPENIDEIRDILFESNKNKIPVTIAGNGTGLTGARVPEGGVVISTEKLNKIIEINKLEKFSIVEPGVLLSEFQERVSEKGLLYPPDPTEKNCFIGGTIATNASGEKTFKYGTTRNFIVELELILASGDRLLLNRSNKAEGNSLQLVTDSGREITLSLPRYKMPAAKNASGYFIKNNMDAVDLFVGSEGTLAVIGRSKLRLVEKPANIISAIVFFKNENDALNFIKEARKTSYKNRNENCFDELDALALEFMDKNSLTFLRDSYPNIPDDAGAGAWFEQESTTVNEDDLLNKWVKLINKCHGDEESVWFAVDEKEKKEIQEFRHALSSKVNDYISKNNFKKLGTDVAVPDDHFEELYYYSKKIVEDADMAFIVYGHFGNSHMHLNMLPKDEAEYLKGKNLYGKICEKTIELNGTVSAEHGIGKLKTEYFKMMYGDEIINEMKKIKSILDPNWILGKGNIFK